MMPFFDLHSIYLCCKASYNFMETLNFFNLFWFYKKEWDEKFIPFNLF
ncbi:hypothetical protein FLCU109888_01245 [Flavobacterium cucumis]|uniref:Uncharacterized protein n=1 Tax=Flavobacterium cucumis TaxID=416016 RepID=A0A1M7ZTJ6_9FLAO|nr:hypothetical protein SAMN05443547_0519 [Flavobacterium cucumis]